MCSSAIDAVTVYPDGATVTRLITVDLPPGDTTLIARDFPPSLDPRLAARRRREGRTRHHRRDRCARAASRASADRARAREALAGAERRARRARRPDRRRGRAQEFAERFASETPFGLGEKGEARPLAEWRAAFGAVAEEIRSANNAIRDAQAEAARDRRRDRARRARRCRPIRRARWKSASISRPTPAARDVRVSYTVRGARWAPLYDARLDTGTRERKPALELIRRAEIVQQTGEDWTDVALSVSTVRTAKGGSAPELRPLIVRYPEPAASSPRRARAAIQRARRADAAAAPASLADESAENVTTFAPASAPAPRAGTGSRDRYRRLPGCVPRPRPHHGCDERGRQELPHRDRHDRARLLVRAAPALDETAYLEA